MKCWDILQKLLESYSVIRADVNPFGALSLLESPLTVGTGALIFCYLRLKTIKETAAPSAC